MKVRTAVLGTVAVLVVSLVAFAPAQADALGLAWADTPQPISSTRPTSTVTIHVQGVAGFPHTTTWTLSADGSPVASGTASGMLSADSSLQLVLDANGLGDGLYMLKGEVKVPHPEYGTLVASFTEVGLGVDRTGPSVTGITVDHPTLYPRVNTAKYPQMARIDFIGQGLSSSDRVEVRSATGALLYSTWDNPVSASGEKLTVEWTARYGQTKGAVPPGTYSVLLLDQLGNPSTQAATVTVSTLHRVLKTYRVTVSAAGSLEGRFVGRCSQLRKPSLRRWSGSLGFYANTKCAKQSWNASAVSTSHAARLPAAFDYRRLQICTYGGAAKSRPSSRGYFRTMNDRGTWGSYGYLSKAVGNHTSFTGSSGYNDPDGFVFSDRYIVWGFVAAYKQRYDVKSFTLNLEYHVLAN